MTPIEQQRKRAAAAGGLANTLAANPMVRDPRPSQQAAASRQRTLLDLRNAQNSLATMPLGNAPAMLPGQPVQSGMMPIGLHAAATPTGFTDGFGATTRMGVTNVGPAMGNQSAIDAAFAARPVGPMPSVPAGQRVAQGMTPDRLFPSPGDAGRRSQFEDYRAGRAAQQASARDMRTQRAQWRNAIGYNSPQMGGGYAGRRSPIFDQNGQLDQLASLGAMQTVANPGLSMLAAKTGQDLAQRDRAETARISDLAVQRDLESQKLAADTAYKQQMTDLAGDQFDATVQNQFAQQQNERRKLEDLAARTEMERERMQYEQGDTAFERMMALQGRETPTRTPAESFASFQGFQEQPPELKNLGVGWAANEIRLNPSRAGEIVGELGISPEQALENYINAYQSPNNFVENDIDGTKQRQKIDDAAIVVDALGVARPDGQKRKLPWLQEFLGFSYANPSYPGQRLDDLGRRPVQ